MYDKTGSRVGEANMKYWQKGFFPLSLPIFFLFPPLLFSVSFLLVNLRGMCTY